MTRVARALGVRLHVSARQVVFSGVSLKAECAGGTRTLIRAAAGLGVAPGGAASAGTPGGDPVRARALWLRVPPLRVRAWHELSTVTASEQQEKHFAQRLQAHQRVPLRVRRPHRPAARGCWPSPRACSCQPARLSREPTRQGDRGAPAVALPARELREETENAPSANARTP